jgi:hypothetical protein
MWTIIANEEWYIVAPPVLGSAPAIWLRQNVEWVDELDLAEA